ncbi:MAG: hypothetical protein LC104_04725 [Bacteroidales bacterium]|nr:hypothetical protein [Bacteroidales bacterium]
MWKIARSSTSYYDSRNRRIDEPVDTPSWSQVADLIGSLDGKTRTEMDIEGVDDQSMTIGGGPDLFIVTVLGSDYGPYELLGDDLSDEMAWIVVGGVNTEMPRRFLVSRQQVAQAANTFFLTGQLDPNLSWHLD